MFRNFFKIAWRNLLKRKVYTAINILGLGAGLAVCLLIVLFVQSEMSFDRHHDKGDNIYRVVLDRKYPGRSSSYSFIPHSIGAAIKTEYPEVVESTRIFNFGGGGNFFLRIGDKVFEEDKVLAVDSNFFRVFSTTLLKGDPEAALVKPNTVVLNETTAIKYFGSAAAAVGKTFETDGNNNVPNVFEITAVCADWPTNSHFEFDLLLSTAGFEFTRQPNYISFAAHTYLLLHPGASPQALESKFPEIIKKYVAGQVQQAFGQSIEDFQKEGNGYRYYLQPLRKIHLISDLEGELKPNGSMRAVYMFSVVAIVILALACINFINLSTARSMERAKEVGIRKTFGSQRRPLIIQFLFESIIVALISSIIAFGLIALLLPLFNQLSGKDLSLSYFFNPLYLIYILLFSVITGLIAGLYPAFVLSSFKPILVLKGRFRSQRYGLLLRNSLVVFQFAISVVLIIATIVVNRQMKYMTGDRLGFRKDHVVMIERTDLVGDQSKTFREELSKIKGVEAVSGASGLPGQANFFGTTFQVKGEKEQLTGRSIIVDADYASLLDISLKEGRFFSKEFSTDSLAVVLNEKAVAELGLKEPIGARLTSPDGIFSAPDGSPYVYTVIGVMKDFHFQSLHQKITPLVVVNSAKFGEVTFVTALRLSSANLKTAIASAENTWKKFVPNRPFHYNFLDQALAAQYQSEQSMQRIFSIFSVLAIFIACIGLFGLAAYSTQQRIREIGIRKVLGASSSTIVGMLSKNFLKLVLIASLIAFPIAWLVMNKWLEDFAYRINMNAWVFLAVTVAALLIALFTISFQAIRAAIANPVKSLRTE
ncbi:MAG TPA: ABC transporter permease [Chitinophagaceae bacterium]|nr:ABC transporter permease [Chitinophagaceae bacterium]